MPQLNLTPWLMVMLLTWFVINVILTLINSMNLTNGLFMTTKTNNQKNIWTWPW